MSAWEMAASALFLTILTRTPGSRLVRAMVVKRSIFHNWMRPGSMNCAKCLAVSFALSLCLGLFGCSNKSESTGQDPNKELTEEQKKHISDYKKQREEEWGPQRK